MIVLNLDGVRLSRADPVRQRGRPGLHGDPVHGTLCMAHAFSNVQVATFPATQPLPMESAVKTPRSAQLDGK